ncbi:pentatricopeptide repeat-containing protein At2g34400 [Diospyros lotus]|uniref:pentatricopeptide repeat-containing protein At2g34400 n=1 Tax=Diospyros lotus TaxID=55363 RepID=UPI002256A04C|nr:pentatricopeptide repeat-containing protein At2g34400 [Diospyros lotus]XP_052198213.1 pentatricopeptide repeat-containing protein At2g34400 [Diospyros lotus]XP_052198214.1 pentatricopeptide repeat-containing protein At2g34400 [Diospyros lotus]
MPWRVRNGQLPASEKIHVSPAETFLNLLKQCISTKTLQQVHTQMLLNSIHKPNFLLSKLVDFQDFNYASLLFSHIPEPNDYAYNIMIRGLTTAWQKFHLALKFYYRMKFSGLKPNNFTYPFVFIACGNLLALGHGQVAHSMVLKNGLDDDGHVSHSLITMYAKCGKLNYARQVFDEIRVRDLVSWNSMISGYSKMGFAGEAVKMFGMMRDEGFEPDEMTIVSVLGACGDLGDLQMGKSVEECVVNNEMEMNSYIGSALIDMYAKCGDFSSARGVFDQMINKDVVTWNAMITGHAQNGLADEAILLFNAMKVAGVMPDKITLTGVLSACASIGALDLGKSVDAYASERGLQHDIYVATALIDMYAKCGSMDHALRIFEAMPQRNEVSWNAMISALAFHGQAQEALLLFKNMLVEGGAARPNDITFVAVLSACVHAGLVDEGRRLFNLMSSSFGLVPKIEHYSCMVDLLARAGQLYEAWAFIQKMSTRPDPVILGTLLGACQKLRNVDIGEKVMRLILEIEPLNSGNYVISSKLYAYLKRWDDSARMRMLMRQKGVTKTPGCSWIELNAEVHEFHAGLSFPLYSEEVYVVIELLYDEMKMKGYTPNVDLL